MKEVPEKKAPSVMMSFAVRMLPSTAPSGFYLHEFLSLEITLHGAVDDDLPRRHIALDGPDLPRIR